MIDSSKRRLWNLRKTASPGQPSRSAGKGFSRPVSLGGGPTRSAARAGERLVQLTRDMDWLRLELHLLTLDHDRARRYLSREGCNIALGEAQLSRTMTNC